MDGYDAIAKKLLMEEQQKGMPVSDASTQSALKVTAAGRGGAKGGDEFYQEAMETEADITNDPLGVAKKHAGAIGLDLDAFIAKQAPEDQEMLMQFLQTMK